jgi:protein-tyrosine-phosphatase
MMGSDLSLAKDASKPASHRAKPGSILFLCAMNAVRSPMAAALTQSLFPGQFYVASAGVHKGEPDPFAVAVMKELGLDISVHQPHVFDELEDSFFDLVITLAPEAHHHALELTRTQAFDVEYWPTVDPTGVSGTREQILSAYRQMRDTLKTAIVKRFC